MAKNKHKPTLQQCFAIYYDDVVLVVLAFVSFFLLFAAAVNFD